MFRRTFLGAGVTALAGASEGQVITVRGAMSPRKLGWTLAHEHLFSAFGSDPAEPPAYDEQALLDVVIPYTRKIRSLGCRSIVDCTAAWFGREPRLLRRISEASGLHILTNTGYYGAANDRYVPETARQETVDQIAARWTAEFAGGIRDTGIRPGHIKIGVDPGVLSELDGRLVRAAARAHRRTGLVITSHTGGRAEAALGQIAILREEGVRPEAWIWAHANQCSDLAALREAAQAGAWLSLDGVAPESVEQHLALLRDPVISARALLSHDGNSFRNGRPGKPYEALFTHLRPRLLREFGVAKLKRWTEHHAASAFTIRRRLAKA